ncbi:MAG: PilZ domain-containing protein [Planctomycetes bacterium]|nr:PilZ domain-containing protein [Planctomycetota bacterium]
MGKQEHPEPSEAKLKSMVEAFDKAAKERRVCTRWVVKEDEEVRVEFPNLRSTGPADGIYGRAIDISYCGICFVPDHAPDLGQLGDLSYHHMWLHLEGTVHHMIVVVANRRGHGVGVQFNDAQLPTKKALARYLHARLGNLVIRELGGPQAQARRPRRP